MNVEWVEWNGKHVPVNYQRVTRPRFVVISSDIVQAKSIFIMQSDELSIGRDKSIHGNRLRLPEMQTSRFHATIFYKEIQTFPANTTSEEELNDDFCVEIKDAYFIVDQGSTHGTFLNRSRINSPKQAGMPHELHHLDYLQIGSTLFQIHIHKVWPCEQCLPSDDQPYIDLQETGKKSLVRNIDRMESNGSGDVEMIEEKCETVQPIQESVDAPEESKQREKKKYTNRAALRRKREKQIAHTMETSHFPTPHYIPTEERTDDNPIPIDDIHTQKSQIRVKLSTMTKERYLRRDDQFSWLEPDESSTPTTTPSTSNAITGGFGHNMLLKMGWEKGRGLGKNKDGISEPISAHRKHDKRGLGLK